jgi:hypothetical protein
MGGLMHHDTCVRHTGDRPSSAEGDAIAPPPLSTDCLPGVLTRHIGERPADPGDELLVRLAGAAQCVLPLHVQLILQLPSETCVRSCSAVSK